uniref:RING-type domain-containing protein n=2 Tax=Parascaris univalens TaxID=6257 RepID=A0A915BF01_PARUN
FWLHCNRCGCLACEKAGDVSKFSITSCGHVFCHGCLSERMESCFVCHRSPFRRQAIDSAMGSQLQRVFMPPMVLLDDAYKKTLSVMAFQRMHFLLSTELLQKKISASNNHLRSQSEIAMNANELRKEMDYLKSSIADIQQSLSRTADIDFDGVGSQNIRSGSTDEDVCSIVEMIDFEVTFFCQPL